MYRCDGCGKPVKAVPGDAIHFVRNRKVCAGCNSSDASALSTASSPEAARASSSARAEAGRKRWADLPEEQRAARLAALANGRTARLLARAAPKQAAVGT